jgi:hypothetical protein
MPRADLRAKQLAPPLRRPHPAHRHLRRGDDADHLDRLQDNLAIEYRASSPRADAWVGTTVRLSRGLGTPRARAESGIDIAMAMRNFLDRFRQLPLPLLEPGGRLIVEERRAARPCPRSTAPLQRLRDGGDLELSLARPRIRHVPVLTIFAPARRGG